MILLFASAFVSSSLLAQQDQTPVKNSTRKIRVKPSELASKIGSAVNWEADFVSALAKSKESGKPIFWYVPTLRGTFMDRKQEIHRYMMAGPFSNPNVIRALNSRYVPIKLVPTAKQQEQYGLLPYKFVEPGFLILDSDSNEKFKIDKLTTLHMEWFRRLLNHHVERDAPFSLPGGGVKTLARDDIEKLVEFLRRGKPEGLSNSVADDLLLGQALFRLGRHNEAKKVWSATSKKYPDEPLAWKAAAEAEGFGPFVRGFEVYSKLDESVFKFDGKMNGSTAPKGAYTEDQVWASGIKFLLGMQNDEGGFVDSDYDFGGTDSLPNVHVAVTSLAGMAMLRAIERGVDEKTRENLLVRIKQAVIYVSDNSNINKADRDEILWAYAYRLRFLSRAKKHADAIKILDPAMEHYIANAVKSLESVQSKRGSWYHEYSNPFVTSTALMALYEGQNVGGAVVDSQKVENGVAALSSDRFANGAFPYSTSRRGGNSGKPGTEREVAASGGRMPLCELGLFYWGKSSDASLASAIERSFDAQEYLDKALKYDDHTSTLAYGGFFFWYDMRARSEAISKIKDEAIRKKLADQQKAIIMTLPEIDGCFVDSHELGRVYGTSMALLSLANCK